MNEIGRVSKPSVNAPPRYTSRNPARCTSHIGAGGIVGIWAGKGGKPNIFIVPAVKKTRPATILRVLNMRSVHGDRDRSNIDICLPIQFRVVISAGSEFIISLSATAHRETAAPSTAANRFW